MYKVRFHLGKGEHFMHWQIKQGNKIVAWVNPSESNLILWKCKLVNNKTTANKILAGADKSVCAWIECEDCKIAHTASMPNTWAIVKFNPKKCNHWYPADKPDLDIDRERFDIIYTSGRTVYAKGLGLLW